jgi:hypothetical protein
MEDKFLEIKANNWYAIKRQIEDLKAEEKKIAVEILPEIPKDGLHLDWGDIKVIEAESININPKTLYSNLGENLSALFSCVKVSVPEARKKIGESLIRQIGNIKLKSPCLKAYPKKEKGLKLEKRIPKRLTKGDLKVV